MNPTQATARRAGLLYFVFMILAIAGQFGIPSFVVPGDPAATARRIAGAGLTYRVDILAGVVTLVLFIFLAASLYRLFRDVDRGHALQMLLLVAIGIAVSFANLIHKFVPLVLLSGADSLSAFTGPQRDALMLSFLRLHGSGATVSTVFWGLWLFPFGMLVIKSGYAPRLLGILLMVAGFGYLVTSGTAILLPEHRPLVSRAMMPLYFGEVPIIFWLLLKGARVPQPREPGR